MQVKENQEVGVESASVIGVPENGTAASVREIGADERDAWDQFVAAADNGHILQSWAWGEYKRRAGWKPIRLAVFREDRICAAAQMLVRSVARLSLAYVPRGPVVSATDTAAYGELLKGLHLHARRHRSIFLKIEPNELGGSDVEQILRQRGFLVSPRGMRPEQPWATLKVDLSGGSEAVFAGIQKRTRQYVRSAERKLAVRRGNSEPEFLAFHKLVVDLSGRRSFAAKPLEYYRSIVEELGPREHATLLLAELDNKPIAGLVALAFGTEGISFQSGSSSEHGNTRANHLLQWKAMEWCMDRGCTQFDMWGIFEQRTLDRSGNVVYLPINNDDIDPELKGIFQFKNSFGSYSVRYIGAFDYVYIRPLYELWRRLSNLQASLTDVLHTAINSGPGLVRRLLRLPRSLRLRT